MRRLSATFGLAVLALFLVPLTAHAESLHVVFPQSAEVTVVQGQSANFTLEVQAFGATACSATTAPVVIDSLYSLDAVGDVAPAMPADMPIETTDNRGTSDNCYIKSPAIVPLTATAALGTPVGTYTSVIRYGKGGDGDVDTDGPPLTIHVIAPDEQPVELPQPELAPPEIIVLGEREAAPQPTLGKTLLLTPVSGSVVYKTPGNAGITLSKTIVVPNGTAVDAVKGVVKVTVVRDGTGTLDSVDAWGGGFRATQTVPGGRGLTTFTLNGPVTTSRKGASAAKGSKAKSLLWVNGKGNFKTKGKRASAIVRGTFWLTEETSDGTKVSVKRGLVAVRDFSHHKTVLVEQGNSYTATVRARPARRIPVFTGSLRSRH